MATYNAKTIEDVARHFDGMASLEIRKAMLEKTQRGKALCDARRRTWENAAAMLRDTTIEGAK